MNFLDATILQKNRPVTPIYRSREIPNKGNQSPSPFSIREISTLLSDFQAFEMPSAELNSEHILRESRRFRGKNPVVTFLGVAPQTFGHLCVSHPPVIPVLGSTDLLQPVAQLQYDEIVEVAVV